MVLATSGKGQRQCVSWIDSFVEWSATHQSPEIFRRWAAITCIAGVLERKVWVRAFSRVLYPNMMNVLCGGPGVGKTEAIRDVDDFWREMPGLYVAPHSVTKASLIDDMFAAKRKILRPTENPPFKEFHSLQVAAREFGVFIPQYEGEFINVLNDLYDCGTKYEESRRGNKGEPKKFLNPQLTILGGTTPSYLKDTLPEGAWQQGFTSRILLIFSDQPVVVEPWQETPEDDALQLALTKDLEQIFIAYGQLSFEDSVLNAFRKWHMGGHKPVPDHPKLEHYLPRRHIHLLKLCTIVSMSRSSDMVVTLAHYREAMDLLAEAERYMPDVFKAMSIGGDKNIIDEAFRFCWAISNQGKDDFPEYRLTYWLTEHAYINQVQNIVEAMILSRQLIVTGIGEKGRRTLRPSTQSKG